MTSVLSIFSGSETKKLTEKWELAIMGNGWTEKREL